MISGAGIRGLSRNLLAVLERLRMEPTGSRTNPAIGAADVGVQSMDDPGSDPQTAEPGGEERTPPRRSSARSRLRIRHTRLPSRSSVTGGWSNGSDPGSGSSVSMSGADLQDAAHQLAVAGIGADIGIGAGLLRGLEVEGVAAAGSDLGSGGEHLGDVGDIVELDAAGAELESGDDDRLDAVPGGENEVVHQAGGIVVDHLQSDAFSGPGGKGGAVEEHPGLHADLHRARLLVSLGYQGDLGAGEQDHGRLLPEIVDTGDRILAEVVQEAAEAGTALEMACPGEPGEEVATQGRGPAVGSVLERIGVVDLLALGIVRLLIEEGTPVLPGALEQGVVDLHFLDSDGLLAHQGNGLDHHLGIPQIDQKGDEFPIEGIGGGREVG